MELSFYSDTLYKTECISMTLFLFMFSWDRNFTLPCHIVPTCNIRNFTLFCAARQKRTFQAMYIQQLQIWYAMT